VVVFFYGGSWQSGSRDTYRFLGSALARRGIVTVVPDYRVYPEVTFPTFLEDGAAAVDWVRDNVARYGGDRERIVLMGHSAGAHMAAMLAIDGRWLAKVGVEPRRDIAGLVGLAGPYDFLPIRDPTLQLLFEGANRPETQPVTFVEGGEAPALLITGGRASLNR
jgi:acetyl esterase/lipase